MRTDLLPNLMQRPICKFVLPALLLVIITAVAYLPVRHCGFIFDDRIMLTENPVLAKNGLYKAWFTTQQFNYWPITWTSYWIEHNIWGLNPAGYHIVNVVLHLLCSMLIWLVLKRLKIPCAWLAALIFAVHPVNGASVAWISQRKNLLSMLFFLMTLLWYMGFDNCGKKKFYWLAVISFILAMLSKGAVAPLPVVLLIVVWWLHGSIRRRDLVRSLSFFAVSGIFSIVEIWFQYTKAMGGKSVGDGSLLSRFAGAGWAVAFYFYKAILPFNLSFIYQRWQINPTNLLSYVPDLMLLGSVVLFWRYRRNWGRHLLFALGYYVAMLLPVLGFFDIYFFTFSPVADHYQYISIIAVISLVVATAYVITQKFGKWCVRTMTVSAAVIIVILATLSWQQCHIYKDKETLWTDTLRKNSDSWIVYLNLGAAQVQQGKYDEAIPHLKNAIKLNPSSDKAQINLGMAFASKGKLDEAIEHFNEALRISPNWPAPMNFLAWLLATTQSPDIFNPKEALRLGKKACELTGYQDPAMLDTLAAAYASAGIFSKAVTVAERALELAKFAKKKKLAEDIQNHLTLFKVGKAYYEK